MMLHAPDGEEREAGDSEYMSRFVQRVERKDRGRNDLARQRELQKTRRGSICGTGVAPRKVLGQASKETAEAARISKKTSLLCTGLSGGKVDLQTVVDRERNAPPSSAASHSSSLTTSAYAQGSTASRGRRRGSVLLEPDEGWSLDGRATRSGSGGDKASSASAAAARRSPSSTTSSSFEEKRTAMEQALRKRASSCSPAVTRFEHKHKNSGTPNKVPGAVHDADRGWSVSGRRRHHHQYQVRPPRGVAAERALRRCQSAMPPRRRDVRSGGRGAGAAGCVRAAPCVDTQPLDAVRSLKQRFEAQLSPTGGLSTEEAASRMAAITGAARQAAVVAVARRQKEYEEEEEEEEEQKHRRQRKQGPSDEDDPDASYFDCDEDGYGDGYDAPAGSDGGAASSSEKEDEDEMLRCLAQVKSWEERRRRQLYEELMQSHSCFLAELLGLRVQEAV